ncbi:MAG: hypothetical protein KJN76_08335 [Eudoraea sp.]|nr:hypothetical protein [Eudoraea sp.]
MKKKDKAKLEKYCKELNQKCSCYKKSWVSHMVKTNFGQESIYDKFSIPKSATHLRGFRFVFPVTPSSPGNLTGWLKLEYDSDVENSDFVSTQNEFGLFKHEILSKDLDLAGVTEEYLIDEVFSLELDLDYINIQTLNVVYLVEGNAETDAAIMPLASFKFKGCCCYNSGKKVFNFNF